MRLLARAARSEGPERLSALRKASPGRRALIARTLVILLLFLTALSAGCGSDDEPRSESSETAPGLTVPQTDEETTPSETETTPPDTETETTPTTPDDGGTTAPESDPPADTPDNDTPPPADSPAERFEEFCDENPGACG